MPKGKSELNKRLFGGKGDLNEDCVIGALSKAKEEKNLEIQVRCTGNMAPFTFSPV